MAATTNGKRKASPSPSGAKRKPSHLSSSAQKRRPSSSSSAKRSGASARSSSTRGTARCTSAPKKRSRKSSSSRSNGNSATTHRLLIGFITLVMLTVFWYLFVRPELTRQAPSYGVEAYGTCIPDGFTVNGIDISHHQGDINWAKLKTVRQADIPIIFVFVKATEGTDYSDPLFERNFEDARHNGFIRGAYHFYRPSADPVAQADFFISHVSLEKGDLPPVIDIETRPSHSQEDVFYAQLATFLYRLEAHYGIVPIIYTSYKYKERYLNRSEFDRYPLWIAHYHVPQLEYTGPWAIWQHSDRGVLPGISEKTDLNVFNGDMNALRKLTLQE